MGLRLKIEGSESINLRETSIVNVKFGADIPHDSNARSTDLGSTVLITGKILAAVDGEAADDTSKIAKWSWCRQKIRTAIGRYRLMLSMRHRLYVRLQFQTLLWSIMKRILPTKPEQEPLSC